jgi:glycosyltransferase involved in cell wall biosynthesis
MKDLLTTLLSLLTGFQQSERILTSKLVPKLNSDENRRRNRNDFRKRFSIGAEDILFVNAGGAWSWTLFHEFIDAFAKVVTDYPDIKFYFFQPALGQDLNSSHAEYNQRTLSKLSKLSEAQRSRIFIGTDWDKDGVFLRTMLDAADYGISFSKESLEHWQSYRVRILEYLSHGVPVITSSGSFWDDEDTGEGFIFLGHREYDLYNGIAHVVHTHTPEILNKRRLDLQKILKSLTLERQAEVLVKQLVGHPYREQEPKVNISPIWDYRKFGGSSRISPRRAFKMIYYGAVNNFYAHAFLVLIGMRRFVRFLRKIR